MGGSAGCAVSADAPAESRHFSTICDDPFHRSPPPIVENDIFLGSSPSAPAAREAVGSRPAAGLRPSLAVSVRRRASPGGTPQAAPHDLHHLFGVGAGVAGLDGRREAARDVDPPSPAARRRRPRPGAPTSAGGCRCSTPRARSSGRCRGPGPPSAPAGAAAGRGPCCSCGVTVGRGRPVRPRRRRPARRVQAAPYGRAAPRARRGRCAHRVRFVRSGLVSAYSMGVYDPFAVRPATRAARLCAMEGAEWLRTQLTSFSCSSCGRAYRSSHIRVVAQRDELFFVDSRLQALWRGVARDRDGGGGGTGRRRPG